MPERFRKKYFILYFEMVENFQLNCQRLKQEMEQVWADLKAIYFDPSGS